MHIYMRKHINIDQFMRVRSVCLLNSGIPIKY